MHKILILCLMIVSVACIDNNIKSSTQAIKKADILIPNQLIDTIISPPNFINNSDSLKEKAEPPCLCSLYVDIVPSNQKRPYFNSPDTVPCGWWKYNNEEICDLGISITENFGNYFKIKTTTNSQELKKLDGKWVESKELLIHFDEGLYGTPVNSEDYQVHQSPKLNSKKIKTLDMLKVNHSNKIKILGCCREWFDIEVSFSNDYVRGWVPWYHFCSNRCTTCANTPKDGFPIYGF